MRTPRCVPIAALVIWSCVFSLAESSPPLTRIRSFNPSFVVGGCRPVLVIRETASNLMMYFATDCTQCIACTSVNTATSNFAQASCSDDPNQFPQCGSIRCPIIFQECVNGGKKSNCNWSCTGLGTECDWTQGNSDFQQFKNCPDTLP